MDNSDELIKKQLEEAFDKISLQDIMWKWAYDTCRYQGYYQRIYMPGEIIPPRMGPFGEI